MSYDAGLEIVGTGLELLKQALPNVRLVAVLWNPDSKASANGLKHLKEVAASRGLQLQFVDTRALNQCDSAFAVMRTARVEAVVVVADSMFAAHRARLADSAVRVAY